MLDLTELENRLGDALRIGDQAAIGKARKALADAARPALEGRLLAEAEQREAARLAEIERLAAVEALSADLAGLASTAATLAVEVDDSLADAGRVPAELAHRFLVAVDDCASERGRIELELIALGEPIQGRTSRPAEWLGEVMTPRLGHAPLWVRDSTATALIESLYGRFLKTRKVAA